MSASGSKRPGMERMPPVRQQWRSLPLGVRLAVVGGPLLVVGVLAAFDLRVAVPVAVLLAGVAAASATYAKNRTDRHNAAVAAFEAERPATGHGPGGDRPAAD